MDDALANLLQRLHAAHLLPQRDAELSGYLPLTAREIAETLWLASFLEEGEGAELPQGATSMHRGDATTPAASPSGEAPPRESPPPPSRSSEPSKPSPSSSSPPASDRVPVYPLLRNRATAESSGRPAQWVRVPAGRALPQARLLARALRPLLRRVPSRGAWELDAEASAEQFAVQCLQSNSVLLPVLWPVPVRWLEVELVVETSASMAVWWETGNALCQLLQEQGAFRRVRMWELETEQGEAPALYPVRADGRRQSPLPKERLFSPAEDRLVLIMTDCLAQPWRDGTLFDWLAKGGQAGCVALLQVLPERLWSRTILGEPELRVFSYRPGVSNAHLVVAPRWEDDGLMEEEEETSRKPLPLPVVTLQERSLWDWARVVAGNGRATAPATDAHRGTQARGALLAASTAPPPQDSPLALVRGFQATAVPTTQRLAGYLASAPLTLPVMRLVQRVLLPASTQAHLAEFLTSGLAYRLPQRAENLSREPVFEFVEGVRPLLRSTVPISETMQVLEKVGAFIQGRLGPQQGFPALVLTTEGKTQLEIEGLLPFAEIEAEALRQIGPFRRLLSEPPSLRINPMDGAEMLWIPPGTFLMGSSDYPEEKGPEGKEFEVFLDGYYIYKTPVTVGQYKQFCTATKRKMPSAPDFNADWSQEDHPIVNVSWEDAVAYCTWAGVRLPTEAEWEKGARGTDGRKYPWGDKWDASLCNSGESGLQHTTPVGSYLGGASPYGLLDMAGNVWEWCSDWYDADYYKTAPRANPPGPPSGSYRVLRGGSWYHYYSYWFRCSNRDGNTPTDWNYYYGFRCVLRSNSK